MLLASLVLFKIKKKLLKKNESPSEEIFDFYSSLSEEQQEALEVKWSEDPASAVDEAITISKASGYSFDRDVLEATVKALLDEDSEAARRK